MRKVPVDTGLICPNRDGTLGTGGCAWCLDEAYRGLTADRRKTITRQILSMRVRPGTILMPYFQAGTNTYTTADKLRSMCDEALLVPSVEALSIATRPDCLGESIVDVLVEVSQRTRLWVEIGVQSAHDRTLERMGRGHSWADAKQAVNLLCDHGLQVCTHVILGLPGESDEDMMHTARLLADLNPAGQKLHVLHVVKGTPLEKQFVRREFDVMSEERYAHLAAAWLELTPPDTVIHRLLTDTPPKLLIAPVWKESRGQVLDHIEALMRGRGSMQGEKYHRAGNTS